MIEASPHSQVLRFGAFELDVDSGDLRKSGRVIRLPPQPLRLLVLLVRRAGHVVSRDDIRRELWPDDTFVDFDQGVNFAVRQVREALGDLADSPLYVQTVPRTGYKFIAPVEVVSPRAASPSPSGGTDLGLHKALWANIAELRMAEERRKRRRIQAAVALAALAVVVALVLVIVSLAR